PRLNQPASRSATDEAVTGSFDRGEIPLVCLGTPQNATNSSQALTRNMLWSHLPTRRNAPPGCRRASSGSILAGVEGTPLSRTPLDSPVGSGLKQSIRWVQDPEFSVASVPASERTIGSGSDVGGWSSGLLVLRKGTGTAAR